ncbi:C2H2-type zinc finger transcription factor [Phycomyces blakesleeanus NRRL 1555(-)]|uniref:C2H2-type zinc finger transcription factor n=2 Tax=Phycomyces blakesleeanus TaxID=4837 RepID=A0A162N9E0_PHYB8|nr:C2H2-type zinc finger transcription factor [Phycomyces blakesleeanus NRRL 1555(-)]OAD67074.1 C2H2-type zinc finger transcription factor [Phycomyces blakesleeanus NRRL 1555(-)]|eukprot:XP_018285114.1 C2H2-type zinc finger transcription factor [Phycomyces blakesleeanus NRRL 1555(-)]
MFTAQNTLNHSCGFDYQIHTNAEYADTVSFQNPLSSPPLDIPPAYYPAILDYDPAIFTYLAKKETETMMVTSSQNYENAYCSGVNPLEQLPLLAVNLQQPQVSEVPPNSSAYMSPLYTPLFSQSSLIQPNDPTQINMFMPLDLLQQKHSPPVSICENTPTWCPQLNMTQDSAVTAQSDPVLVRRKRGRPPKTRLETNSKRHKCYFCPYKTDRINNFIRHIQSHTQCGENWKCAQCPKSYCSKSNLVRHVEKIHK